MKLLFFVNNLNIGGAERVLVNLSNELVERGHDVWIAMNSNVVRFDVDGRVRLLPADEFDYIKGSSMPHKVLRALQLNRHYANHTKNTIASVQPDVIISFVHANMRSIIRYHRDTPIVLSEHNAFDRKLGWILYWQRFNLSRLYDKVCVLTPFDQGYACSKGLKNTIVMPNPNTFNCIEADKYNELFLVRKDILLCGRLDIWQIKGFDLAIQIFAKISDSHPDVEMNIAGDGNVSSIQTLTNMAEKYGVKDKVHFLGRRKDVKELMQRHKLFLLPSRTEGFPMVLTEAMTQGLPCVAFERLASSIINHSIDGYLVENENIQEMVDTVDKLLSDDQLRNTIGLNALANVNRFSIAMVADRWEKMFYTLNRQSI